MMAKPTASDVLLRRPEVQKMTGLPTSSLYAKMARGEFPLPIKLGLRAVAWHKSEVDAWKAQRPRAGRAA